MSDLKLIKDEVYCCLYGETSFIFKYDNTVNAKHITNSRYSNSSWAFWEKSKDLRLATKEEKDWLNFCIEKNKFISKENFLEQRAPEFIVGRWYKYNNWYLRYKETRSDGKPYDVTTLKESKELSLLEQAKLKYPIGTKYKCLHGCGTGEIFSLNDFECDDYDCIRTNNDCRCVYNEGKWAEIVEQPKQKEMSIQEIQAECKRRFPIGCKFKSAGNGDLYTLNDVKNVYTMSNIDKSIDGGLFQGYLYYKGKYAELISLPEVDNQLQKSYIKTPDECFSTNQKDTVIVPKLNKIDNKKLTITIKNSSINVSVPLSKPKLSNSKNIQIKDVKLIKI